MQALGHFQRRAVLAAADGLAPAEQSLLDAAVAGVPPLVPGVCSWRRYASGPGAQNSKLEAQDHMRCLAVVIRPTGNVLRRRAIGGPTAVAGDVRRPVQPAMRCDRHAAGGRRRIATLLPAACAAVRPQPGASRGSCAARPQRRRRAGGVSPARCASGSAAAAMTFAGRCLCGGARLNRWCQQIGDTYLLIPSKRMLS